ncbi:MAG: FtsX-like permease family protein, partial [Acidobacteriia bacterium]|nr:FtsX-like permease family protein [Terriglobia bacterium]
GPEMYVPYTQKPYPSMSDMGMLVRTIADPASVAGAVRNTIRRVDPELPVANLTTLAALVDSSLAAPRFSVLLMGAFGILALLLEFLGMYSVISYAVTLRTREIGIRMALGARPGAVLRMVLGRGGRLAAFGIAIGLAAAVAVSRAMASLLFGVKPTDISVLAAVSLLVATVAVLACYVPARRATQIDPTAALRM